MTKDNEDAVRCAEQLQSAVCTYPETREDERYCSQADQEMDLAAWHLRRLVAENEAQAALLRQALEALKTSQIKVVSEWEVRDATPKIVREALAAITKAIKEQS